MKAFIILLVVFSVAMANPPATSTKNTELTYNLPHFLLENAPKLNITEDLTDSSDPNITASANDIKFIFFSRDYPIDGIEVNVSDPDSVQAISFDPSKRTFFAVHGWLNDCDSPFSKEIREALLLTEDCNIFIVDWSKIAKLGYVYARLQVPGIGKTLGGLISDLVRDSNLQLDQTVLVGHSLGAHVVGIAGAAVNGEAAVLIGLDPAWPLFVFTNTDSRLDITDAKYVQVIHTCGGLLGFPYAIGHVDYFPNGGGIQPGCELDLTGSCSHGRSFEYLRESIISGNFAARQCDNYDHYKKGKCLSNPETMMGEIHVYERASGNYYLTTNSKSPYAKGDV